MAISDVRSFRKLQVALVATAAMGVCVPGALAAPAQASTVVRLPLRAAIDDLPVAAPTPAGYQRSEFKLWVDADGDCQNTRAEVLVAESKALTTGGCTVQTGRWFSYYDRATWMSASDVDIDHLVPLGEAWASGANTWNAETRMRYANDLSDPRTLLAVTDNVNEAKGDQDPAEWLPTYGRCRYVRDWTAVKLRWGLSVDPAEKAELAQVAAGCTNPTLTVTKATVVEATSGAGDGTSGLDPRFRYCYQAKAAGYGPYHQGKDPEYSWYTDPDHDGIACE